MSLNIEKHPKFRFSLWDAPPHMVDIAAGEIHTLHIIAKTYRNNSLYKRAFSDQPA